MNLRDICLGMTVYHTLFTHYGAGVVKRIVHCTSLTSGGAYVTVKRVSVQWSEKDKATSEHPRSLRKTPNRKKIQSMVELYRSRGANAKDGGDRLILPTAKGAKQ